MLRLGLVPLWAKNVGIGTRMINARAETVRDKSGDGLETFTIITTEACENLADIHHRQPAIIHPDRFGDWLDPASPSAQLVDAVRKPYAGPFEKRPVSMRVNNVTNNDAAILDPASLTAL